MVYRKHVLKNVTSFCTRLNGPLSRSFAVRTATGLKDVKLAMKEQPEKLFVVDWTASWCGPCKMMAPVLEEMSEKFSDVVFYKIDVDEHQEDALDAGIRSMPTFQLFKDDLLVDQFSGADSDKLLESIKTYK